VKEKRIRCLLSGEEIPLTIPIDSVKPIFITQNGVSLGAILGASLTEVKTLKVVLKRDSRTGNFVADHAACIEAFRDDLPLNDFDE